MAMGSIRVMNSLVRQPKRSEWRPYLRGQGNRSQRGPPEHLPELQQGLLKDDVYISLPNADPEDLALKATVSTSSELGLRLPIRTDF